MRLFAISIFLIVLPVLLSFLVSCMKVPETNHDYGPEVPYSTVKTNLENAQLEATDTTYLQIKANEFVYHEQSNQVESLAPFIFGTKATTLTKINSSFSDKSIFTFTYRKATFDGVQLKPTQDEEDICIPKVIGGCGTTSSIIDDVPAASIQSSATPPPYYGSNSKITKELGLREFLEAKSTSSSGPRTTYHNFKKVYSTAQTPALVLLRLNCGGNIKICDSPMKTIEITFDAVDWTSEQYPVKYSYKFILSPDAPFFAAVLSSCLSTTIPYSGQRIAVMQCDTVRDFSFGSP